MKISPRVQLVSPGQLASLILAAAIAIPAAAQQQQQPQSSDQSAPSAASQQPSTAQPSESPSPAVPATPSASSANTDKEGFWGHVNPFARKKWVKKRLDPMNDKLTELDEVNAKNSRDIKDVDGRATAGINKAQSSADAANQTATAAGDQARKAGETAQNASGHVDQLNTTVNGLDQYKQISDVEVPFRGGSPVLSKDAKEKLDEMATSLSGHKGYIIELEAHSPSAGSAGIQISQREAEAVKRYLVSEHEIPVYRLHTVALGNAKVAEEASNTAAPAAPGASSDQEATKPAPTHSTRVHSSVHIRLMENSLAAQDTTSPHGMASSTGAERP